MIWTIRVQSEITANFLFPAAGFPNGVLPELPRIARILGGCISVRKRSPRDGGRGRPPSGLPAQLQP